MSDEQHLPGYNVDDDPHDESTSASQSPAVNLEHPSDPVSVASAGDATPSPAAASTSPSPPISTQPTPAPPSQQEEEEGDTTASTPTLPQRPPVDEFADPKIAELHQIFPDYDAAILHSVVDSVGGNQDRAVDALLAMSDPEHVPTHNVAAPEQPSAVEQTLLDEEFARQLMLEDEQQYAREQIARRQQEQQQQQQFPYAQRTNAPIPHQQQQGGRGYGTGTYDSDDDGQHSPPQRDTMTDMQEQFSKLAESGKRTFSTFVSKVKAKVQEFDQTRNAQNPSSAGTSTGTGYIAQPSSPGLDRHAQQAYYAPRAVSNPRPPVGPEVENPQQQQQHSSPSSTVPTVLPSASASAAAVDDDSAGILPPPVTNNGRPASNIDPGKIGLLPKRPVSLVNTESQPSHAQDEEEELEYVENPFEEGKYS